VLLWGGGFGLGAKFGLLSTRISWLTGSAAVVSGLSAVTYWLAVSGIYDLVPNLPNRWQTWKPEFPPGYLFPVPVGFLFPEYRRNYGLPCAWPEHHGRGRFYATYLARTCHYGCTSDQFPGLPAEKPTRMAGCCDLRYQKTWFPWFLPKYFTYSTQNWRGQLAKSAKVAISLRARCDANSTSKNVGEFSKNGNYSFP